MRPHSPHPPYSPPRVLFAHHVKEFEAGILANLMPETAEEAMALVPSLKVGKRAGSVWGGRIRAVVALLPLLKVGEEGEIMGVPSAPVYQATDIHILHRTVWGLVGSPAVCLYPLSPAPKHHRLLSASL